MFFFLANLGFPLIHSWHFWSILRLWIVKVVVLDHIHVHGCPALLTQTHTSLFIIFYLSVSVSPVPSFLCVSPPQPVHNNGSSGYGSLGSNGSHEHYISVASSSDSNGNLWEDAQREPVRHHSDITGQEVSGNCCQPAANVNPSDTLSYCRWLCSRSVLMWIEWRVGASRLIWVATKLLSLANLLQVMQNHTHKKKTQKTIQFFWLKWAFISPARLPPAVSNPEVREPEESRKQTHIPSYQQINCVDNIIRCVDVAS